VVRSAALEAVVRAAAGAALAERHLRLADVPEGAELLPVEGQSWPVLAVGNVVLLPGVPHLFRRKFLGIAERFRSAPFHHRVATVSQDEALLAPVLDRIDAAFPAVAVGSYPELIGGRWRVRITLESKDAAVVEAAFRGLLEGLPGAEPG
jgi:molybdopterin-biosynthesis enzyme MoeA-like protein